MDVPKMCQKPIYPLGVYHSRVAQSPRERVAEELELVSRDGLHALDR